MACSPHLVPFVITVFRLSGHELRNSSEFSSSARGDKSKRGAQSSTDLWLVIKTL